MREQKQKDKKRINKKHQAVKKQLVRIGKGSGRTLVRIQMMKGKGNKTGKIRGNWRNMRKKR